MGLSSSKEEIPTRPPQSSSSITIAASTRSSATSRLAVKPLAPRSAPNPDDPLECPICLLNYKHINLTDCCHQLICTSCVDLLSRSKNICPYCNKETLSVSYEINKNTELIDATLSNPQNLARNAKQPVIVIKSSVADRMDIERNVSDLLKEGSTSGGKIASKGKPSYTGSTSGSRKNTVQSYNNKNYNIKSNNNDNNSSNNSSSNKSNRGEDSNYIDINDLITHFLESSSQKGSGLSSPVIGSVSPTQTMEEIDALEEEQMREAIRLSMLDEQSSTGGTASAYTPKLSSASAPVVLNTSESNSSGSSSATAPCVNNGVSSSCLTQQSIVDFPTVESAPVASSSSSLSSSTFSSSETVINEDDALALAISLSLASSSTESSAATTEP